VTREDTEQAIEVAGSKAGRDPQLDATGQSELEVSRRGRRRRRRRRLRHADCQEGPWLCSASIAALRLIPPPDEGRRLDAQAPGQDGNAGSSLVLGERVSVALLFRGHSALL